MMRTACGDILGLAMQAAIIAGLAGAMVVIRRVW